MAAKPIKMVKLNLYSIFHLNMAFSSIAEKDFPIIINRCFWPMLRIAEDLDVCLGIEASGYSLGIIKKVDPKWIEKLKELILKGKCEFIGSGYVQLIGPLVPPEINKLNLKIGNQIYSSLLGLSPSMAFVNEQTYSKSLLHHYLEEGYKSIFMEWNNPVRFHSEWPREWRYHPQIAVGAERKKIPIVWNNSISFQKFQRYANAEIELSEYLEYLKSNLGQTERFFPIYGNDAEIFDFRPGRFSTESKLAKGGEWNRIYRLFKTLKEDRDIRFVEPSELLKLDKSPDAFHKIYLESPEDPIPVKKQEKYNVTRWALAGKDSVNINTKCFRIYKNLKQAKYEQEDLWTELCFLWSSDFRTHIEKKRYDNFKKRLGKALRLSEILARRAGVNRTVSKLTKKYRTKTEANINKSGKFLKVDTKELNVVFNMRRGLTIDSLIFKKISSLPLLRTLPHGFYDDISFGADYFTGHTVIGSPGKAQITDLDWAKSIKVKRNKAKGEIIITARSSLDHGWIDKKFSLFTDKNVIELSFLFNIDIPLPASFRTGFVTLNPEAFDQKSLFYSSHNGGQKIEKFLLRKSNQIGGKPVSFLVSSASALGNTSECLELGDKEKKIIIETDMALCAALPMIHYVKMARNYFFRSFFSIGETDDTAYSEGVRKKRVRTKFVIRITGENLNKKNIS